MKRYLLHTALLVVLLIGSTTLANASNYYAGSISYKQVGQDSFLVNLMVIRDCNGIALDTLQINIEGIGFSHKDSIRIAPPAGTDITPVCDSLDSRCANSSSTFPYGMERYNYSGLVVLSGSGCNYRFSTSLCCYNSSVLTTTTASGPMYLESYVDACLSSPNSSPVFGDPLMIACAGACIAGSFGTIESDGDSLVYGIDSTLTAFASPIQYNSPYAYDKPLYFNGFANPNLPFNPPLCRGFHVIPTAGTYAFRPMQAQVTVWSIGIDEYRNGVKIGSISITTQLNILNCPANDNPRFTNMGNDFLDKHITACAGQPLCIDIEVDDPDSTDTVELTWSNTIPGASFTVDTGRTPTSTFCWTPDSSDIRSNPYTFTVIASDRKCPIPGKTVQSFSITVVEAPKANTVVMQHVGCGAYTFDAAGFNINQPNLQWWIDSQLVSTSNGFLHYFKTGGQHIAELRIVGPYCSTSYIDTLQVPVISQVDIGPDTIYVCHNNTYRLIANYSGWGVQSYNWTTGDTTKYADIHVTSDTLIMLFVQDTHGCLVSDTIQIMETYPPTVDLGPSRNICSTGQAQLQGSFSGNYPNDSIVEYRWYMLPSTTVLGNDSVYMVNGSGDYLLTVTTQAGCTASDTVKISDQRPIVSAGKAPELCLGDTFLLNGFPSGGTWAGPGISGNVFYTDSTGTGNFNVTYSYTSPTTGCDNWDTMEVIVQGLPNADAGNDTFICAGDTIQLHASGGLYYFWSACPELDSFYIPNPHAITDHKKSFLLSVTDINGCHGLDSVVVDVDTACVWPGDADYDGVVNNIDLLSIGLAYGNTGPARPNASIVFTAQPAYPWDSVFASSGRNRKHADCNGDSSVTAADTVAISLNYSQTHNKGYNKRDSGIPLYFKVLQDSVGPSDTVVTLINLGDSATPATDVYGIAFTVTYSSNLVDSGSISFNYMQSWLGQESDLLHMSRDFFDQGKVDVAITRIDHAAQAGQGRISKMSHVITDNIDGKNGNAHPLVLDIVNVKLINAFGDTISARSVADTVSVFETPDGLQPQPDLNRAITLYPNPATGQFTLNIDDIAVKEVYLADLLGKQVKLQPTEVISGKMTFAISSLRDGVYFISVVTPQGLTVKKLLIQQE